MKELSIEEKAKAYDEAIKRARYWEKNPTVWSSDDICQKLFPELKESWDEKIRKSLINYFRCIAKNGDTVWTNLDYDKVIAWLEKQGILQKDFAPKSAMEAIKEEKVDNANKVEPRDYSSIDPHFFKPVDKVKRKFHKRDWCIDNQDGTIFQIVKVLDNTYTYKTIEGKEYSCTHYSLENDARLWTIQDAKDGDVLATENFIFIFKNIDNGNGVHYYCHYEISKHEDENQFGIALPQSLMGIVGNNISHYSPATKEQRDQLKKAMADAGYTFDFDKKELKKIEQKCSEEDEHRVKDTIYFLDTAKEHYASTVELDACIDWLKSLQSKVHLEAE